MPLLTHFQINTFERQNKMKNILSNKIVFLAIFAVILAGGVFLRSYNFSPWLHFELDQSRDAKIISSAVEEGIGELPLLGPRAAGTFLRLGPMFYYLEYLSAKISGNTPPGMAMAVLVFSVLAIPLFYFFCRRYFDKKISLGLLLLFSVSLYLIMYSRFAWNPNPIPFFVLAICYSLLRVTDSEEKRKNIWLYVFAAALAVGTQLHFLAFIIFPAISVIFLLIKRPRIKAKVWLSAFLIVVFFYLPVIINDCHTGGASVKEFIKAFSKKSVEESHNLPEKVIRDWTENSLGNFLILTGNERAELFQTRKIDSLKFDIKCDKSCRQNLWLGTLALLLFTAGFLLLLKQNLKERESRKKNFLQLVLIWFAVSFVLFIPISFNISPRFFLITAPLPFIFLGFILEFLNKKTSRARSWAVALIILFLAVSNLFFAKNRFEELRKAPYEAIEIKPDKILKERTRVTLEQEEMIIDYLEKFYRENQYPVYIHSDSQYERAFKYLLEKRDILYDDLAMEKIYRQGNYFLIFRAPSDSDEKIKKYEEKYVFSEKKQFGTLAVFRLAPKKEAITDVAQKIKKEKKKEPSNSKVPKRYTWKEIFSGDSGNSEDLEDPEDPENLGND